MNEIKQASIYLRVLWLNDNENLRPDDGINIKLNGDIVEETTFTITQNDNNVGNNAPWEANEWANGITYNYQKEPKMEENLDENDENSEIDGEKNENTDFFPMVIPNIVDDITLQNYRKNIIKNAETEEYAYYTIKMTYVPPKRKKMARNVSTTPSIVVNGTQIENVNFNGTQIDKVVYNGVTVFEKSTTPLFKDIILANSTLNEGTPDFSLTATTDEGMFETDDPMYGDGAKSQYFRGAVLNNYVKFANFWWRIIRINGDGTVRMIYDGTSGHANGTNGEVAVENIPYNTNNDRSEYVGYTYVEGKQRPEAGDTEVESNIKIETENWYKINIIDKGYDGKVTIGKFCNDREVQSGYTWASQPSNTFNYASYNRLQSRNIIPTLSCTNTSDIYNLKVGAITADEAAFAGGLIVVNNTSYYLYNGQKYLAMSPAIWYYKSSSNCLGMVFYINYNGYFNGSNLRATIFGIRPVINLASDVQVTGTGTIDDPYVVI